MLLLSRNYVCWVYPINRDFSWPAQMDHLSYDVERYNNLISLFMYVLYVAKCFKYIPPVRA